MSSSEAPIMACISRNRSGYMHTNRWTARGVAAALIALGAAACTDPTVAPTSTVTGANFYNDLSSYQAFLAKVYAGLAVGGQNGGDGSTDIQGIDGGFSQYMRLYWELEELPTDEAVIAWGEQTLPELNTQGWNRSNTFVPSIYYRVYFYIGMDSELLRQPPAAVIGGGYSLAPNYFNNFEADNNTSPEIIFAVPEDGIHTQTYGSTNFIIHASCGNSMNHSDYGVDGCRYGLRLKPSAHDLYGAGDKRAANFYTNGQTVAVARISTFGDGIPNPKFTNKTSAGGTGSNPAFADTDFPMFRLGEAYLIYAEASLRGGGGTRAQALAYLNALRARAYGDTLHGIPDSAFTVDSILAERGRELMWEAHRPTDLVRYGLFTGGGYIWAWKGANAYGTDSTGVATDSHLNLYPIPGNELIANPNLKQNPGYPGR